MQELSMHILDIAQNSVKAGATLVEITLAQDTPARSLVLTVHDNGCGMDADMVRRVTDPFCTTRTTRKVGLGVPLLKMATELTEGSLAIQSEPGVGTNLVASFGLGHIDLPPLGDMGGTAAALVGANPDIDFVFAFLRDGADFTFDTREAREMLGGVPLSEPAVAVFIREYVDEHLAVLETGTPAP